MRIRAASSTCRSARRSTRRPPSSREALRGAADAPGYPQTDGTPALREAVGGLVRPPARRARRSTRTACCRRSAPRSSSPGCRRCSASGRATSSCIPGVAYPTYDVGARLAGARPRCRRRPRRARPADPATTPKLVWLNTPGNPTARVLGVDAPRARWSRWAREHGVVVASDECYAELDWRPLERTASPDAEHPRPAGQRRQPRGPARRLLAEQAVQPGRLPRRRSSPGDATLVARLLEVRKHAGLIVPAPVQPAMIAALGDDEHVAEQKARYRARRAALRAGARGAGFRIDHSEAGLYLWATRGEDALGDRRRAGRPRHPRRLRALLRRGRPRARARRADRDRRADRRGRRALARAGSSAPMSRHGSPRVGGSVRECAEAAPGSVDTGPGARTTWQDATSSMTDADRTTAPP